MSEELVIVSVNDGIGELVLNRPQKRNSLIGPLVDQLDAGLRSLIDDDACHVVLIRGAEGYFCAGLDLKAFSEEPAPAWRADFQDAWTNFHNDVFNCPKPVLGAMESFAIAGGSALALACDFLVVGKESFMQVSEVEMGRMAPMNLAWLSIRFSHTLAMRMAVIGQKTYGEDLLRLGIATDCVDDSEILSTTRALGRRLADFDAGAVHTLKASLRRASNMGDFLQRVERIKDN